ncbi:MAG: STAS domain-containing protein [Ferruginibacter sp.]
MNLKIDTKEKFTVISPKVDSPTANMTEEFEKLLLPYLNNAVPHLILNLSGIDTITEEQAENIASIQQQFYEKNCSFLVCEMNKKVEDVFEKANLLEVMNITPTESEAWDIVQLEEIERELLDD